MTDKWVAYCQDCPTNTWIRQGPPIDIQMRAINHKNSRNHTVTLLKNGEEVTTFRPRATIEGGSEIPF